MDPTVGYTLLESRKGFDEIKRLISLLASCISSASEQYLREKASNRYIYRMLTVCWVLF